MLNKENAPAINNLLELLHDSLDGYHEAAKAVKDLSMKDLFIRLASLRTKMISEMEAILKTLGIEPEITGTMLGAGHRLFLDLKSLVTGGNVEAIVSEVRRGEEFTIERFKETLKSQLPQELKDLIAKQLTEIQSNLAAVQIKAEAKS